MDTYQIKWTQLQTQILRTLCIKTGTTLNLRGIAKLIHKTPTAISNVLPELKKQNLIKIEKAKEMNLLSIELNRDNPKTIEYKRIENLKLIYETELADYLIETFQGSTIILFGSYSKGEDTINSDIDICIVGAKEKDIDLTKFDKLLERKINLNFFNSFESINKHLLNNIINGILLNGYVEL